MTSEHALNGRAIGHVTGKYPTGLKIGLGLGIPAGLVVAFFGIRALTSDHSTNSEKVQKAFHSDPGAKTDVMQNPSQYQQQAIKDLNNKTAQLYLDADKLLPIDRVESEINGLYEYGYKVKNHQFKVIGSTRLSKGEMRKIDKQIDEMWPGFRKAWFVQTEEGGGYLGYFLVEGRTGGIHCYRRLSGGDPMYGVVVDDHQIYHKK